MKFTLQGPFELFSVGGDVSDANVVKFSNDGRLMLVTTTDGHIHVLDSFRGTLVRIVPTFLSSNTSFNCFIFALKGFLFMWLLFFIICTQLFTYNVTPVSCNSTLEASFSPDGMFVISSKSFWITQHFFSHYGLVNSLMSSTIFCVNLSCILYMECGTLWPLYSIP